MARGDGDLPGEPAAGKASAGGGANSTPTATPLKLKLKLSLSPQGVQQAKQRSEEKPKPAAEEEDDVTMSVSESTKSAEGQDADGRGVVDSEAYLYPDDVEVVYGNNSKNPERMTARQRAMVGEDRDDPGTSFTFKGGIDQVFAKPKKELTSEQLLKKAELNEERRVRAIRLKREQQVAVQRAIREGKGAKAKREDKLNERREERLRKRKYGAEMEGGTVRISVRRGGNTVTWSEDLDLPEALRQPKRDLLPGARRAAGTPVSVPMEAKWSKVRCGSTVEVGGKKRTVKSINRKANIITVV